MQGHPTGEQSDPILKLLYQFQIPTSPNYASTLGGSGDRVFSPPSFTGEIDTAKVLQSLKAHVKELGGAELEGESSNGLHYVFTSSIFKFKDDLYLGIDTDMKVVHILSRSRTGYYDFNVNKQRLLRLVALIRSHGWGNP